MAKSNRVFLILLTALAFIIAIASLLIYIFTLGYTKLVCVVFFGLMGAVGVLLLKKAKKNWIVNLVGGLGIFIGAPIFIFCGLGASPISGGAPWQFNAQMKYTDHYFRSSDYFISELPDGITDYYFDFLPSILQGSGHKAVSFRAPSDYVESLTSDVTDKAVEIHSFDECSDTVFSSVGDVDFYCPVNVRAEHPNATVYILDTNRYPHRPHSTAVIIDGDFVLFSEL